MFCESVAPPDDHHHTQVKHMRKSYGSEVIFTLMNSFSTSADTRAFLKAKHPDLLEVRGGECREADREAERPRGRGVCFECTCDSRG